VGLLVETLGVFAGVVFVTTWALTFAFARVRGGVFAVAFAFAGLGLAAALCPGAGGAGAGVD